MRYVVQVMIRLETPLTVFDKEDVVSVARPEDRREQAVGYVMVMRVSADSFLEAARMMEERALLDDEGRVQEVTIEEIPKEQNGGGTGPSENRRGVYYCSGRAFFGDEDEREGRRWWQFWKR